MTKGEDLDLAEEWANCPKCREIRGLCEEHRIWIYHHKAGPLQEED